VSAPINPALHPPGAAGLTQPARVDQSPPTRGQAAETKRFSGPSFADVLKGATSGTGADKAGAAATSKAEPLRFSKHALERVQRRGIALDPTTLGRLREGVGRAAGKGSRDSIVLVDGTAFVVSVNNRTVVTAVGSEHMREHVFTNIDSAVIA
jgi:flagellar operon protein